MELSLSLYSDWSFCDVFWSVNRLPSEEDFEVLTFVLASAFLLEGGVERMSRRLRTTSLRAILRQVGMLFAKFGSLLMLWPARRKWSTLIASLTPRAPLQRLCQRTALARLVSLG